ALCRVEGGLRDLDGLSPLIAVLGAVDFGEAPRSRRALVERRAQAYDFGTKPAFLGLQIVALLDRRGVASASSCAPLRNETVQLFVNGSHDLGHASAASNGL